MIRNIEALTGIETRRIHVHKSLPAQRRGLLRTQPPAEVARLDQRPGAPRLAPTLRPDDIVIMDNLGSHKGHAVRRAIRAAGAKLFFLPKYSPDLNPIEQVFAKLKHLLRKAAARNFDAICAAIGQLLASFAPHECANYVINSGYERT